MNEAKSISHTKVDESSWFSDRKWLPDFLRDFHDQKDVFKLVQGWVEHARTKKLKESGGHLNFLPHQNWIDSQIYVIDYFLRFMACCGYTLQRSRSRLDFYDIQEAIKEMKKEELESLKLILEKKHEEQT